MSLLLPLFTRLERRSPPVPEHNEYDPFPPGEDYDTALDVRSCHLRLFSKEAVKSRALIPVPAPLMRMDFSMPYLNEFDMAKRVVKRK
jgi:hypothetical protein